MLCAFSVHENFVNLNVMGICICVNGLYLIYILSLFSGGLLIPSMGIREGDPAISPFFLFCAECLSSMLEEQSI